MVSLGQRLSLPWTYLFYLVLHIPFILSWSIDEAISILGSRFSFGCKHRSCMVLYPSESTSLPKDITKKKKLWHKLTYHDNRICYRCPHVSIWCVHCVFPPNPPIILWPCSEILVLSSASPGFSQHVLREPPRFARRPPACPDGTIWNHWENAQNRTPNVVKTLRHVVTTYYFHIISYYFILFSYYFIWFLCSNILLKSRRMTNILLKSRQMRMRMVMQRILFTTKQNMRRRMMRVMINYDDDDGGEDDNNGGVMGWWWY